MTLTHKIKLLIPRIKWLSKALDRRKLFLHKKRVFQTLVELETELVEEYIRLERKESYVKFDINSPHAKMYAIQGKLDLINNLFNDKQL